MDRPRAEAIAAILRAADDHTATTAERIVAIGRIHDSIFSRALAAGQRNTIEHLASLAEREPPEPDGECFRGREAAAFEAEQMSRIQRELK